jgi:hypothetical protein
MSLTPQDKRDHALYEALPEYARNAIDETFEAVSRTLSLTVDGFEPNHADPAEALIGAIARFLAESMPTQFAQTA